jgi:hypothetical protein
MEELVLNKSGGRVVSGRRLTGLQFRRPFHPDCVEYAEEDSFSLEKLAHGTNTTVILYTLLRVGDIYFIPVHIWLRCVHTLQTRIAAGAAFWLTAVDGPKWAR